MKSRLKSALLSMARALNDPANRVTCEYCGGGRVLTRQDGSTVECSECFGSGTVSNIKLPAFGAIGGCVGKLGGKQ